jgi:hypothetical protein
VSTRSIIAIPDGDGWKGRYAHCDGYPEWMGRNLWRIVQRDGLEKARSVLVEDNFYWSSVNADQAMHLDDYQRDGRFAAVVDYGICGTEHQASPDEWITHEDNSWCQWVYVLGADGLLVGTVGWTDDKSGADPISWVGMCPWHNTEPEWPALSMAAL